MWRNFRYLHMADVETFHFLHMSYVHCMSCPQLYWSSCSDLETTALACMKRQKSCCYWPLVAHHIKELSTNIRRNGDMILKRRWMQEHFHGGGESWECEEDRRRENGGNCDFDICVNCMKNHGVRKVLFECEKVGFWLFSSSLNRQIIFLLGQWSGSWLCWSIWTKTCKVRTRKIMQNSRGWSNPSNHSWWGNLFLQRLPPPSFDNVSGWPDRL